MAVFKAGPYRQHLLYELFYDCGFSPKESMRNSLSLSALVCVYVCVWAGFILLRLCWSLIVGFIYVWLIAQDRSRLLTGLSVCIRSCCLKSVQYKAPTLHLEEHTSAHFNWREVMRRQLQDSIRYSEVYPSLTFFPSLVFVWVMFCPHCGIGKATKSAETMLRCLKVKIINHTRKSG